MRHQCEVCESLNVTVTVHATASDNEPAEISFRCNKCGEYAYFAYGHYEDGRCRFRMAADEEESNAQADRAGEKS